MGGFMSSVVTPIPYTGGDFGASIGNGMCCFNVFNTTDVPNEDDAQN
jgi:hypothetical protein